MSNETNLTVRGRLTDDPEMRFTASGSGVANFSVAVNASKFDKDSNSWKDQPAKFWRCVAWNQGKLVRGENVSNMLKKGDSVIVFGELVVREYTDKEGATKLAEEIRVESVGKDLTFHGQAHSQQSSNGSVQGFATAGATPPASDPWASPQAGQEPAWGNGPANDEQPPF